MILSPTLLHGAQKFLHIFPDAFGTIFDNLVFRFHCGVSVVRVWDKGWSHNGKDLCENWVFQTTGIAFQWNESPSIVSSTKNRVYMNRDTWPWEVTMHPKLAMILHPKVRICFKFLFKISSRTHHSHAQKFPMAFLQFEQSPLRGWQPRPSTYLQFYLPTLLILCFTLTACEFFV